MLLKKNLIIKKAWRSCVGRNNNGNEAFFVIKKTNLKDYNLIKSHLKKLKLPISLNCLNSKKRWNIKNLIKNMQGDKKRVDENIKFILLKGIGKAYIQNSVSHEKINLTIQETLND